MVLRVADASGDVGRCADHSPPRCGATHQQASCWWRGGVLIWTIGVMHTYMRKGDVYAYAPMQTVRCRHGPRPIGRAGRAEACSGARAGGRVVASPYARRLAAEAGVDVGQAQGTGPGGRIVAADVQKLIESGGGKGAPRSKPRPAPARASRTPPAPPPRCALPGAAT